jgi:hypothetical protein
MQQHAGRRTYTAELTGTEAGFEYLAQATFAGMPLIVTSPAEGAYLVSV